MDWWVRYRDMSDDELRATQRELHVAMDSVDVDVPPGQEIRDELKERSLHIQRMLETPGYGRPAR
jgi:anaerobic glycerol-3-phosphate dehydrogenase